MRGWATFKDGKPHTCCVEKTKRLVLIGYDMISLRGLRQTELHLKSKGIEVVRAIASITTESEAHCLMPVINKRFSSELMGYSSWSMDYERSFSSMLLFFSGDYYPSNPFSREEQLVFKNLYFFPKEDGRRKSTYMKLLAQCEALLLHHKIRIVPVKIERID